jgi:hypothetical protein
MTTRERAAALAQAAQSFPWLGLHEAEQLLEVVRMELGHAEILDDFQPYGGHFSKAIPAKNILHIVSSNTPHAALQSLIRGLLIGAHNLCKIPSGGLPEPEQFRAALPAELAAALEITSELDDAILQRADAVIVFGSDETIAHFRSRVRANQIFQPHGHKFSIGIVFDDPQFASARHAARDASLFDQQGCLSAQVFYVANNPAAYAEKLAQEMARFEEMNPRLTLDPSDAAAIRALRESCAFRRAAGEPLQIWTSPSGTAWTVIFDPTPAFTASPLNRVVFVKPLPENPAPLAHLSTAGLWPASEENARRALAFGARRLCRIGEMQNPPWTWHQDGGLTLAPLVEWVDFSG